MCVWCLVVFDGRICSRILHSPDYEFIVDIVFRIDGRDFWFARRRAEGLGTLAVHGIPRPDRPAKGIPNTPIIPIPLTPTRIPLSAGEFPQ